MPTFTEPLTYMSSDLADSLNQCWYAIVRRMCKAKLALVPHRKGTMTGHDHQFQAVAGQSISDHRA